MDVLKALIPESEGFLPKWLLLVSVVAALNSVQAYTTLHFTQRVYSGGSSSSSSSSSRASDAKASDSKPAEAYPASSAASTSSVTPLSARTFGTWTFLSAVVRFYAAYNTNDKAVYELCFWTYVMAFAHFVSEWLVFRTAKWGAGLAGPVFVSTGSLIWMWSQWGYYVQ